MGEWNEKQARWAKQALLSFEGYAESLNEGDSYTAVRDLLCDLMHFCDQEGINWDEVAEVAATLHDGEVAEDE